MHPLVHRRPVRAPLVTAAGAAAGLLADLAFDPAHRHVPLCPFHEATGWWCPLCGGLRAAQALAHGDVSAALHDNALFLASLPLLAVAWVLWLTGRGGPGVRRHRRVAVWALVALAVAFTVVRNLPGAEALRPRD